MDRKLIIIILRTFRDEDQENIPFERNTSSIRLSSLKSYDVVEIDKGGWQRERERLKKWEYRNNPVIRLGCDEMGILIVEEICTCQNKPATGYYFSSCNSSKGLACSGDAARMKFNWKSFP